MTQKLNLWRSRFAQTIVDDDNRVENLTSNMRYGLVVGGEYKRPWVWEEGRRREVRHVHYPWDLSLSPHCKSAS